MIKEKPKEESSLEYWWNEFLFRKKFTFESELPPDVCAAYLERLETPREGWWKELWRRHKTDISLYSEGFDDYRFEIQLKRRSRSTFVTTARAEGKIYDDQRGITVVEGEAKLGILNHIVALFGIGITVFVFGGIISSGLYNDIIFIIFSLFVIGLLGFVWWQLLSDRNQLIEKIRYSVLIEKAKR